DLPMVSLAPDKTNPARVIYHVGKNAEAYADAYREELTEQQALDKVKAIRDARGGGPLQVIVQAQGSMPFDTVQQLTVKLELAGVKSIQAKVRQKPGGSEGGEAP